MVARPVVNPIGFCTENTVPAAAMLVLAATAPVTVWDQMTVPPGASEVLAATLPVSV